MTPDGMVVHDPLCIHLHLYVEDVMTLLYGMTITTMDSDEIWGPVLVPIAMVN